MKLKREILKEMKGLRDYYSILGISKNADFSEIKRAYRRLVKLYHPDVNPQANKRFYEISRAYQALKDPVRRKQYDFKLQTDSKNNISGFRFREFRNWLMSFGLIKAIFSGRKISPSPEKTYAAAFNLDTSELLQRVRFSSNPLVGQIAVKALLAKKRSYVVNDLLRLLYIPIHEEVKLEIIRSIGNYPYDKVKRVLKDIYSNIKSLRLRTEIRKYVSIQD